MLINEFGEDKNNPGQPNRDYEEFSFYDHMRFMKNDDVWSRFTGVLEPKEMFLEYIEQVRKMRNQLAHLRGRLDTLQRRNLRHNFRTWLNNRPQIAGQQPVKLQVSDGSIKTTSQSPEIKILGLGGLTQWLRQQPRSMTAIQLQFDEIEKLIGEPLPSTAYKHGSWWSNDLDEEANPTAWMLAGWKVYDIDLNVFTVVFHRDNHISMQMFFWDMLQE